MLDWLEEAELDRVGCFKYENVQGAASNALEGHVDAEEIDSRWERFMETQQVVSERRLQQKIGRTLDVLVDQVDDKGAVGRCYADSPEVDGVVFLDGETHLKPGDMVTATVTESSDYDLWAELKHTAGD